MAPESLQTNPLLPSIQEISWTVTVPSGIVNLSRALPFISPSLKSLEIIVFPEDSTTVDIICQFFDTLAGLAELDLETFKIERYDLEAPVLRHLSSFLTHHQNMKSLEISSYSYFQPRSTQPLLFSNLPNGVRDLKVNVEFYANSDYTALVQAISQRLPSLRALKSVLSSLGSWDLASFEDLSPFLQFSNLEELNLWVSEEIHFNTGDIYTL